MSEINKLRVVDYIQ